MPSWQSYLLDLSLRLVIKRRLKRLNSVQAARGAFSHGASALPQGARQLPGSVGSVPGEWVSSDKATAGTMLYLHGGGYFSLSPATHRAITGAFANLGFAVFAPDYRLAPEHPFPAALEDALAVYRTVLRDGIAPQRLVLAGDSAGGGLALATLLAAKAAGLPMPGSAILFSPWTDLAATGASLKSNLGRDAMLRGDRIAEAASFYVGAVDPRNPLISPLYGDLAGLPPLFIQVGGGEVLRDDAIRLAERARAEQVQVTLGIWPNMPHVWQLFQSFLPEARTALAEAGSFALANLRG